MPKIHFQYKFYRETFIKEYNKSKMDFWKEFHSEWHIYFWEEEVSNILEVVSKPL